MISLCRWLCVVPEPKWPIPTMRHLDPFLALLELLLP